MLLDLVTGWTLFAGILVTTGALALRWAVLPRCPDQGGRELERAAGHLARLGAVGAGLVAVGLALFLLRQFVEFRDPFAPAGEELALLLSTSWGAVWKAALGVSSLALIGFLAAARRLVLGWWIASVAGLTLGIFPGLTGHAAAAENAPWLSVGADALHVWAAGGWVGGLGILLALDHWVRRQNTGPALATLVPLFSPVALASAGVLAATGLLASYRHLNGLGDLWATEYGRWLSVKILLVLGVMSLGALNWRRLTPGLGAAAGDRSLRRAAGVELLVAQAVLLATSILVRTSPGGH